MTTMGRNSLRWRLPLSYAVIALITALALAGMLLLALHSYYLEQERRYLLGNARTIGIAIQLADSYHLPAQAVQAQVETFSFFTQTRVRLLDGQRNTVADSGLPIQQQALTLRYDEQGNGDGPVWLSGGFFSGMSNTVPAPKEQVVLSFPAAGNFYGFDLDQTEAPAARRSAKRLTVPIPGESGAVLGYVELSEGPAYGRDIILSVAWGLLIAASVAILLAAGMGWLISRRISAPVVALAETTLRMTTGDLSTRADVERRDEIGVLAHAFNEMAARIEETINTLRAFVSDAAHELHTPLTALHTDLELAAVDPDPVQRAAHLERALEQMRRLEGLTANLLALSRLEAGIHEERRPVDLSLLLAGLSEVYASRAEQAGSTLQLDLPGAPMMVQGYDVSLRQAVGNLLDNAIKFTPPGGQVQLSLYQDDPWVVISVKDTGIGIPGEDLPHLFRRFHRGRNAASYPGSGLGLAITQSIIQAHGGTIEVRSSGEGTCFRILYSELSLDDSTQHEYEEPSEP
jgi:signal transduction histidine kinase